MFLSFQRKELKNVEVIYSRSQFVISSHVSNPDCLSDQYTYIYWSLAILIHFFMTEKYTIINVFVHCKLNTKISANSKSYVNTELDLAHCSSYNNSFNNSSHFYGPCL